MYHYTVFGLSVLSDIKFNLIENDNNIISDIHIKIGNVDVRQVQKHENYDDYYWQDENNIYICFNDCYAQINKDIIIIDNKLRQLENEEELWILNNVLSIYMVYVDIFQFHSSSFYYNNSGIVICGESGSGKSTIVQEFVSRGASFISDDITVIDENLNINPSMPLSKIWDKTNDQNCHIIQQRNDQLKYLWNMKGKFINQKIKLNHIFCIEVSDSFEPFHELSKIEKYKYLLNNINKRYFYEYFKKHDFLFEYLNKLISEVEIILINRSANSNPFELCNQIENHLNKPKKEKIK